MLRKYILVKKIGFSKPYSKKIDQLSKIRIEGIAKASRKSLQEQCDKVVVF